MVFGARAVQETEMKQLREELINSYNVSPIKIRRAGLEEMQQIRQQEMIAQTRNGSGSVNKMHQSRSMKQFESFDNNGSRAGFRGQSQVIKSKALQQAKHSLFKDNLTDGEEMYGEDPIGEDFTGGQPPVRQATDIKARLAQIKQNAGLLSKKGSSINISQADAESEGIQDTSIEVGIRPYQRPNRYRVNNGPGGLQTPQSVQGKYASNRINSAVKAGNKLLNPMDAQRRINQHNVSAMGKLSPLQHPSQKAGGLRPKNQI